MVERGILPIRGRMALRAVVTEIACDVIRVCRLLELRLMTLVAVCIMQLVVAIHMARLARRCDVSAR
jgi:hypothetical protein